jgi:hypothetical protein
VRRALSGDAGPEEICAYFEQTHGISVRPIDPPSEPALEHAAVPSGGEAIALAALLDRLPATLLAALRNHGALTHILLLKTSPRTALGAYSRGIVRLFPRALRLRVRDPLVPQLSVFEATLLHELGEAVYRLYLDREPRRLVGITSLCTPELRSLFEDCYLWWLETGEPRQVPDDSEPHVLAVLMTMAVASPHRVRAAPFRPLLAALGLVE